MFSYNNIIQKEEPVNKALIDTALADAHLDRPSRVEKIGDALECMVVHDFLPDEECEALMQACEQVGYTYWRQASADPKAVRSEEETSSTAVREVDTIEANFPTLSKALFNRIQHCIDLPTKSFSSTMENADEVFESDLEGDWVPYALSENLLFGRYGAGGHFMPHIDGSTIVDINTRSMYTLLIYLNSCPQGGETFIFKGEQSEILYFDEAQKKYRGSASDRIGEVKPIKGTAAFFYYDLLHEGAPVQAGKKCICRGDVLYRREPPILTSEKDIEAFRLYQEARQAESSGNAEEACKMFQRVRHLSLGVAKLYQLE